MTAAGKHFEYVDEPLSEEAKNKQRKTPTALKVRCTDTGEIFSSAQKAGQNKKIYGNTISAVCRGQRKIADGLHWEYI